jgi:hypothetical protein
LLLVLREDLDNVAVLAVCDLEHIGARWQHSARHLNGIAKGHKGLFVPLVCMSYGHENCSYKYREQVQPYKTGSAIHFVSTLFGMVLWP